MDLHGVKFFTVTKENLDDFLKEWEEQNGNLVFFAISVPHYENMSLNVAELRRYIDQQRAVIVYYETQIKALEAEPPKVEEEVAEEGTINNLKDLVGLGD